MKHWNRYNPIGAEEKAAVNRVLDSGVLSKYIGAWHEDFNGGVEVNAFEHELAEYFGVPHAVVFNSLTSGLIAAMGAMGVQPGDEILVTPWSMSATATAILIWGGIPVFVDIEPDFYGIDPNRIAEKITKKTKGIIVADIFGHGARLDELRALADQHHLFLIEDVAQAPGIQLNGKFLGTWGDVGGFSLNYHKHIHTG
ncbi:MAG: aminotransferase class I/II-fold pyridoxal phosphate-dependent enzyme, partial [Reinekea sp.]|nr:aminotransferase class I/II-fold pyridoxal phosphate-dependent enzyme [Reinekea sp.]